MKFLRKIQKIDSNHSKNQGFQKNSRKFMKNQRFPEIPSENQCKIKEIPKIINTS